MGYATLAVFHCISRCYAMLTPFIVAADYAIHDELIVINIYATMRHYYDMINMLS